MKVVYRLQDNEDKVVIAAPPNRPAKKVNNEPIHSLESNRCAKEVSEEEGL